MQLAGTNCEICRRNILLESDGTWCARCTTVLHRECLSAAGNACPSCHRAYDPPDGYFVFSRVCPECFSANDPPKPSCAACRARTRWDNQADYDNFLAHMKDTSRVYMLQGAAEIGAALMCLLAPFAFLLISGHPSFTGLFILGFFTLSVHGIVRLIKSRQIARFC